MAVALALFIVFIERPAVKRSATPPSTALVSGLQREQVSLIEITQTNQPAVRLRRSGSLWHLEAPLHYPAQFHAAERWLQLLEQAQWVVRLPAAELNQPGASLADFGLAPPRLTVTLRQGDETFELRIGNFLALGRQLYVQLGGQPDVFVVDQQLAESLPSSVTAWRDTALVPFMSIAVSNVFAFSRIEVRPSSNGYTLQHEPLGGWRITRPVSARGDSVRITQFVQTMMSRWHVEEFVTDDPAVELASFGLQTPGQELVIGRGTNDLIVVQFGRSPTDRPELVYARLLNHTNIVLTARTNLDWLRLPYSLWRDRLLVHLDTNKVSEILGGNSLTNGAYRIRRQSNDVWRVVSPEELPVDAGLVAEFFDLLNSVEIGFEKDVVTDFSTYGLTEPAFEFTFRTATNGVTNAALPAVSFGTNTAGGTFARRSDETAVYSVQPALLEALPLAHWQWRDRSIWEFTTNEVQRVRLWHNNRTREILRNPDGKWQLAPGSTGALTLDLSFDETIFQLGSLKADRWVGMGRIELGPTRFGFLSNQVHRVSIETSRLGVLRTNTVEFGGVDDKGRPYALVRLEDDRPWFFEFPMPLYYQLVRRTLILPEDR